MGMNYYLIQKNESEILDAVYKVLKELNAYNYSIKPMRVHLGKSSSGWQFIFDHNDFKYFSRNIHSFMTFVSQYQIIDQYEKKYTFEEFFKIVDNKRSCPIDVECYLDFGLCFNEKTDFS